MWPPPPALPDRQSGRRYPERLPTGYRVFVGLCGTLIGSVIGLVGAFFAVAEASDGNVLEEGFALIGASPIGMILGAVLGAVAALRTSHYLRRSDLGLMARRKKTFLTASLVVGLPCLVVGPFQAAMHHNDPPPDQQLLANFSRHSTELNRIVAMAQMDKRLTRVDDDWTQPDDPQEIGIPPTRIAEYRRLLRIAGTPRGFQTPGNPGSIEFYYYLTGSAISSDTDKGYAYLVTHPANLLDNLDSRQPDKKNGVVAYRHIQGDWYLFYEYIPG